MITFIEKYFKVLVILLLLILCLLLYAGRSNGRYMLMLHPTDDRVYILDTKTSELWVRLSATDKDGDVSMASVSCGTNEKPKFKILKTVKVKK